MVSVTNFNANWNSSLNCGSRKRGPGGHLCWFSWTNWRPSWSKTESTFFPHVWDCLLAALGKPFAGLPLLTSTQAQILNLLEGFADSYDAARAGLLKILKGQKRHGITVAQRRYVWRLHWEVPGDDRGYWPTGQNLICGSRSSDTSASALSSRQSACPSRSQPSAHQTKQQPFHQVSLEWAVRQNTLHLVKPLDWMWSSERRHMPWPGHGKTVRGC